MHKHILAFAILGLTLLTASIYISQDGGISAQKSDLQTMADKINSDPHSTWKAISAPKQADYDYLKGMFNLIIDEPSADFDQQPDTLLSDNEIPVEFDSRLKWPNCESIKEIRDQSACGASYAVSAASTMSDRVCIASGQTDQRLISSEDILTCCKDCGEGCKGNGFIYSVWDNWKNLGFVTGSSYLNKDWCKAYSFPPCNHQ